MDYSRAANIAARLGQLLAIMFGFIGLFSNSVLIFRALFVWISAVQEDGMSMSPEAWREFSEGSPVKRAKRRGFLRKVAVALGNSGDPTAIPALTAALDDEEPLVRSHAARALGELGAAATTAAMESRFSAESDTSVLYALRAALGRLTR